MKMMGGESPTVSRLYRIPGVDWLLVQFHDYAPVRRLEWVASGQYLWTFEYQVSYGRPTESPGTDATCSQGQVSGR